MKKAIREVARELVNLYSQPERTDWGAIIIGTILGLIVFFAVKPVGADVLSVAQSEIGHGEYWGNNRGPYVRQYLNGRENLPWCAGFVSYCLKKSGSDLPYLLQAKSFIGYGRCVCIAELKKGDLVIFNRKGGGHVGIVETINKNSFISIEGNVGKYPAKVKRVEHNFFEVSIYRFVRLT